jgi:hypothetical protein
MSDKLIKKLTELVELIKASGTPAIPAAPKMPTAGGKDNAIKAPNLNPTLRLPSQNAGNKVQQLATTNSSKSLKDPMHQAKQIQNNSAAKDFAMNQASMQNKANTSLGFGKSEAEEKRFYLVKEGQTSGQPKTESEILSEYGSFGEAEKQGHKIVPVVKEYLKTGGNGQWTLTKADDKIDKLIRDKMKQEMDRRGLTGQDIADHYRDIDETIPAKQRSNIKNALKQQKIKEQPKPKLTVVKKDLEKSNEIKPFGQNIYDEKANMGRKETRTSEVRPEMGRNQAVRFYTTSGSSMSAAHDAAETKRQKKKSKESLRSFKDMSPEEQEALKAKYNK